MKKKKKFLVLFGGIYRLMQKIELLILYQRNIVFFLQIMTKIFNALLILESVQSQQKHMLLFKKSTLNDVSNRDMFYFRACCFQCMSKLFQSISILFQRKVGFIYTFSSSLSCSSSLSEQRHRFNHHLQMISSEDISTTFRHHFKICFL